MASEEPKAQAARIIDSAARYISQELDKGWDPLIVAGNVREIVARAGWNDPAAQNRVLEAAAKKAGRAILVDYT